MKDRLSTCQHLTRKIFFRAQLFLLRWVLWLCNASIPSLIILLFLFSILFPGANFFSVLEKGNYIVCLHSSSSTLLSLTSPFDLGCFHHSRQLSLLLLVVK